MNGGGSAAKAAAAASGPSVEEQIVFDIYLVLPLTLICPTNSLQL